MKRTHLGLRMRRRRIAFTLVELLVVIAIIGILVALLLPAVQAAREAARRMSCNNNLKQAGLAAHNYHDTYKSFPSGYLADGVATTAMASMERGHGFAWGSLMLPFIEQQPLHDAIDFRLDCRDANNMAWGATQIESFRCPSDSGPGTFVVSDSTSSYVLGISNYVGLLGYGSVSMTPGNPAGKGTFYRNSATRFRDIIDGTSNTIMIGERTQQHRFNGATNFIDSQSTWYAAVPGVERLAGMSGMMATMTEAQPSLVLGHAGQPAMGGMMAMHRVPNTTNHIVHFSSQHPGGIGFVACDGSVRFLSETIQYETFRRLGVREDGLPVSLP